ncbi:hypothetical protein CA599_23835 [Paenibacillus taichungensis]|nr:hypothetical protein CA599_23835 [Paenibacillus taichungensis]
MIQQQLLQVKAILIFSLHGSRLLLNVIFLKSGIFRSTKYNVVRLLESCNMSEKYIQKEDITTDG